MAFIDDTIALYLREMTIFRANLRQNIARSVMFPVIILLIFGFIGSSSTNIPVAVVNYANNPASLNFISSLHSQNQVLVKAITNQNTALTLLKNGNVDMVVVILPSFPQLNNGNPTVDIYYSNSEFLSLSALPFIEAKAESFGTPSQVSNYQPIASSSNAPATGMVVATPAFAASGSYFTFLAGGVLVMVIAFSCLFSAGTSIIQDRSSGTLKMFQFSPASKNSIIMSRVMSGTTQALISAVITIIIVLLLGGQIAMGPIGLIWILLICAMIGIGMSGVAVLLATRIKKFEVYTIAVQGIALPLWFLAGALTPIQSLPSVLQYVSKVDPLYYAANGLRSIMMIGTYPLNQAIMQFGILAIFAIIIIFISSKMFKKSIE